MLYSKVIPKVVLCMLLLSLSSWGFLAHKTIHQLAIYQLPNEMREFYFVNKSYLVQHAVRPDLRKKFDSTEGAKHFMDMEAYGADIHHLPIFEDDAVKQYTKDTLRKYGYVPYAIMQVQQKLTHAFKNLLYDSILYYSADLGHYLEDACVPLHSTVNHYGQLTNQKGIHSLWESACVDVSIAGYQLNPIHQATYIKHPEEVLMNVLLESHGLLKDVFGNETQTTKEVGEDNRYKSTGKPNRYTKQFIARYSEKSNAVINQQLLKAARLVSDFWYTAWVNAGKPDLKQGYTWDKSQKKLLKKEQTAFQKNNLLTNNLLLAKEKNIQDVDGKE